jgi:acyl-CoA thioesterase FadM
MVLTERKRASFLVSQELLRGDACLLRARVRIACLHANDFSPRALPSWLAVDTSHGDVP